MKKRKVSVLQDNKSLSQDCQSAGCDLAHRESMIAVTSGTYRVFRDIISTYIRRAQSFMWYGKLQENLVCMREK